MKEKETEMRTVRASAQFTVSCLFCFPRQLPCQPALRSEHRDKAAAATRLPLWGRVGDVMGKSTFLGKAVTDWGLLAVTAQSSLSRLPYYLPRNQWQSTSNAHTEVILRSYLLKTIRLKATSIYTRNGAQSPGP